MSRTRTAGLLAFTPAGDVGVDIECVRPEIVTDDLAGQMLSAAEMHRYRAGRQGRGAGRAQLFFEVWTRKEAYVKAAGAGLSLPLQSITVLDCPTVDQYSIYPVPVDVPAHLAALAVKGSINTIRRYSAAECPLP